MEAQGPQQPPGWYPNPQGPGQRYWDGAQWTDDARAPQPQPQPQPQQQQPPKSGGIPGWVKVLLGLFVVGALAVVVGVVGCAGVLGEAANEVEEELREKQNRNAITDEQALGVKRGTTRGAVESRFGPPKSDQETSTDGLGDDTCIYYNAKGNRAFRQWQFCFEGSGPSGRLTNKNRLSGTS